MNSADHDKDIFSIRLDREGLGWVLRFCRAVKLILLLSILVAVPSLLTGFLQVIGSKNASMFNGRPLYKMFYILYPYWWMLYIILWVFQIYFYWKFSVRLKKAVEIPDEKGFNASFRYLYYNARMIIAVCIISFLGNMTTFLINLIYRIG